ncbi:MAG: hypothetical protein AAF563_00635 [Pseudomonadota bacterium]
MNRHVAHTFTAEHGDHDRTARSRSFWIVVTLILLVSMGVLALFALKLQSEYEVWKMDPSRFIVPLDRPADLAVAGNTVKALDMIEGHLDDIRDIVEGEGASYTQLGLHLDWEKPDTVITVVNAELLLILLCVVQFQDDMADPWSEGCQYAGRNAFGYRTDEGFHVLARAFFQEAEGRYPAEVARMYAEAGRILARGVAAAGTSEDDLARREVAARLLDFADARVMRMSLLWDGLNRQAWTVHTFNPYCMADRAGPCPGGVATYRAIAAYLAGDDQAAIDHALVALEGAQPWVYQSPYEHPLLWLLAASRRSGIEVDREPFRHLIDAALSHWPIDARLALAVLIEEDDASADEDETAWSTCTTPGCHYFVAAYLAAAGNAEQTSAMMTAGRELCLGVRSIPCAALRTFDSHITTGGSP